MVTIKILTGSVRPGRFNDQVANWLYAVAQKREDMKVELLDLSKINLPFLDEPSPPKMHKYTKEHTKEWSKTVDKGDGFIFITPEYNHSYSAVLKNAIDYLFYEWNYKPVTLVSYGSLAGGARAIEHLRGVAAELKMYDLQETILLPNYWTNLDEKGQYKFTEDLDTRANEVLTELIFWSEKMKTARAELKGESPDFD